MAGTIPQYYCNNFKTFKINNEIISINDGYLLRFNKNRVDSLILIGKNTQGFQIGDRFYIIDNNILSEIKIIKNPAYKSDIGMFINMPTLIARRGGRRMMMGPVAGDPVKSALDKIEKIKT